MSIRNIQALMAHLAQNLKSRLAVSAIADWRIVPEAGNEIAPVTALELDVPRVVLQSESAQNALSNTPHRCFRFDCSAVTVFTPSVADADGFPALLGILADSLAAEIQAAVGPVVTGDVQGCYILAAHLGAVITSVDNQSFNFRQEFTLVVQF